MIDINDLLSEQPENKNNDMIFVTATENREPTVPEVQKMGRLDRIQSSAVIVDEPLFDGVTDLDLGRVTLGSEGDTKQINKNLLQQKEIIDASNKQRDTIVKEMTGSTPEDVIENFNIDIPTVPLEVPDSRHINRVNSKAIQEIIDDLHKTR